MCGAPKLKREQLRYYANQCVVLLPGSLALVTAALIQTTQRTIGTTSCLEMGYWANTRRTFMYSLVKGVCWCSLQYEFKNLSTVPLILSNFFFRRYRMRISFFGHGSVRLVHENSES